MRAGTTRAGGAALSAGTIGATTGSRDGIAAGMEKIAATTNADGDGVTSAPVP
jgi:hypothetical protein